MSYAQRVRMWNTEVPLAKTKMEIEQYLEKQGADQIITMFDKERCKLVIRFRLKGQVYIIEKQPLPVQMEPQTEPVHSWLLKEWDAKKAKLETQAVLQMGRLAKAHVELIISLAAEGHDEVLDVYRTLAGSDQTFQRLRPEGLMEMVRNSDMLALPASSDFIEVTP